MCSIAWKTQMVVYAHSRCGLIMLIQFEKGNQREKKRQEKENEIMWKYIGSTPISWPQETLHVNQVAFEKSLFYW